MPTAATAAMPGLFAGARPGVLRAPGRRFWFLTASALTLLLTAGSGLFRYVDERYRDSGALPAVPAVSSFGVFYDLTPTEVQVTRNWLKFAVVMPRYQFLADPSIWRQMHFEDWDRLDEGARRGGLAGMLAHHGHLIADPAHWQRMSAADWDDVPQPVRAMAIVGMIEHWAALNQPGAAYGLDPGLVLRTSKAIAMSESWFDHRAVFTNRDGSQDLGVGGASEYARDTLRRWHARGLAEFTLQDEEYFNPWLAARWLVFWVGLTIDEAGGDLELAVRAYNVGIARARAGDGIPYLEGVERRRHRYFEGPSHSPTWADLSQFRRDQQWLPRVVIRPEAPTGNDQPPARPDPGR